MELFPVLIAILFFLAGLAGTVLPMLPGTPLIFAGMIVYGLMTGFEMLDFWFFLIQGIAVLVTFFIDHVAAAVSTSKFGGSKTASLGAILGLIFGTFFLGPLGLILGAFFGAFAGDIISGKSSENALKTGFGVLVGFLSSAIIKVTISVVMIVWFFVRIL